MCESAESCDRRTARVCARWPLRPARGGPDPDGTLALLSHALAVTVGRQWSGTSSDGDPSRGICLDFFIFAAMDIPTAIGNP